MDQARRPDCRNLDSWLGILEKHGRRAKWCIFYDPVLAVRQRGLDGQIPFDFGRAELLDLWRSDLDHLRMYFEHLIPGASLQYDDTEFQQALGRDGQAPVRLLAHNRDDLRRVLESLRRHATSDAVLLGTAKGCAEGTTLLPTGKNGPEFGRSGSGTTISLTSRLFTRLSSRALVRTTALFSKFGVRRRRKVTLALQDVDVEARIGVKPRATLLKDKLRSGFERRLVVEPGARVSVRNLDRRRIALLV